MGERGPQKPGREMGRMGAEDPSTSRNQSPRSDESPRPAPRCPHCGATDSAVISLFGTQAMTLQYRCRQCGDFFEAVKYDAPEE